VTRARALAAGLLIAAALLFAIGTRYEAAERSESVEPSVRIEQSGGVGRADHDERSERGERSEAVAEQPPAAGTHDESSERVLGIDASSLIVLAVGVAASFVAAGAVLWLRRRPIDLAVAGFAAVFGLLDVAEAIRGLRVAEVAVGALALLVAVLHLTAAGLVYGLTEPVRSPAATSRS
jgi:hypothetical protein